MTNLYKSTLGNVTTLGRPASISIHVRATLNAISKLPNDLADKGQWPPYSIPVKIISRCIFGANLVILAQIHYKLLHRQVNYPRILSQNGQNDIGGQGRWPLFSIPTESIPGCMFGAHFGDSRSNLASYRADKVKFTDGRTDGRTYGRTDGDNGNALRLERPRIISPCETLLDTGFKHG